MGMEYYLLGKPPTNIMRRNDGAMAFMTPKTYEGDQSDLMWEVSNDLFKYFYDERGELTPVTEAEAKAAFMPFAFG